MIQRGRRSLVDRCSTARHVLGICLLLFIAGPARAQELERESGNYTPPPGSMPPWTVAVLRLVSSTHVEPTTGIVISDSGLVLVPEDFAGMGDEIIVLDGGTDIIRNGRPARIEQKFVPEGLQVLFVEGLTRSGVTISADDPGDGSEVMLTAFPPAEQIAEGKPPLNVPASIVVFAESGNPVISGETRLPNVTGALTDHCGNLAGVSIAHDIQTMEHSPATRYQWRQTLLAIFETLKIAARQSACSETGEIPVQEAAPETPVPSKPPEIERAEPAEEPLPVPDEEEEAARAADTPEQPVEAEDEQLDEILPPMEQVEPGTQDASPGDRRPWPWLVAALVLIGTGLILHRWRRTRNGQNEVAADKSSGERKLNLLDEEEADSLQPVLDSVLRLRGVLPDGSEFETSCPVSENAVNVMIGRGDAELRIDSPAVSRRHACLNGTRRELTVTDLGSSNGTSINGVPCLEHEIMFIEPGDRLVLGNATCTIEILAGGTPGKGIS